MTECKNFASVKVAVPLIGLLVLVIVAGLVAVFYVRNPTVTDGLFGTASDQNEPPAASISMQSEGGASAPLFQPSSAPEHVPPETTHIPTTLPAPQSTKTPHPVVPMMQPIPQTLHPIEPVLHM